MSTESKLATDALDMLRGARGLPPKEAATQLRNFLISMSSPTPESDQGTKASAALETLIDKLDASGSAADDDWQLAIETMNSLANETN